jgi:hypothetical protein
MTFFGVTLEFSGVRLEFLTVKWWTLSAVTLENDPSSMKVKVQVGKLDDEQPFTTQFWPSISELQWKIRK